MTVDAETLEFLKNQPEITFIREDELHAPTLFESTQVIHAPQAWNAGFSGQGQVIAILDTGVDKNHPFLRGKVISEACYSTNFASQGYSSVCPSGVSQSTATNSGLNCNTSISGCSHGTHVAGIAAGSLPSSNFYGVARDSSLVAIQVFSRLDNATECAKSNSSSPCTRTFNSDYIKGLERVLVLKQSGVNIASANMSLGGEAFTNNCDSLFPDIKVAIDNLRSAGVVTLIASGNGNEQGNGYINAISSPACISSAVSVGSTGDGSGATVDVVSTFSNSSTFLNLLAPGQVIQSSVPNGSYDYMQGTSQATPHVAGAWAILKQRNQNASVTQILNILANTGDPILDSRNNITKPRIRLDTALSVVGATCVINHINSGQPISGQLTSTSDCSFFDALNRYYDYYAFTGIAGQRIAVSMNSAELNTFLYLKNPNNQIIITDDNGGGGTNSRIPATSGYITLPVTGTYSILATSFDANRTGAYSISLTTENTCTYSITPTNQSFPASGGNGSMNVNTQSGCAWSATSNVQWITTSSSGSGSNTANFAIAANSGAMRTGMITVAGQTLTVTQAAFTAPSTPKLFDFDGDGKADISVFRPSNGIWYLQQSTGGFGYLQFGSSTDRLVPADYDGDGKTDIAVFRNGTWYLQRSAGGFTTFSFGIAEDIPASADFDGDGKADIAVFRPSNGNWYLNRSQLGLTSIQFGQTGDKPVAADYDGDGKADLAVFRPSNGIWYLNQSLLGFTGVQFGQASDRAVPADYDGDGKTDVAVYRPSNGTWYINRSQAGYTNVQFGISTDLPAPADFDGDGKTDLAVFRDGIWYLNRSTAGLTALQFGSANDKPIPNAFVQ